MNIDKGSWHYRLWLKYNVGQMESENSRAYIKNLSLCYYMRGVMYGIGFALLTVAVSVILLMLALEGPLVLILGMFYPGFLVSFFTSDSILTFLSLFFWASGIAIVICYHVSESEQWQEWRETRSNKPPKFVNTASFWYLCKQWVKSKHDKVCPLMTVGAEEKTDEV